MIISIDAHLLRRISRSDTGAFESLFKQYKDTTYSFAVKVCQSSELAEEVVQDVFMNIWTNRSNLMEIGNFGGYLRVVTRNHALIALRRLAVEARCHAKATENWQEMHNETENAIYYNETRCILHMALESLPPQQKLIYQMCHLKGMKQREVAEQLHISPLTVKAHLRQAMLRIRECFIVETAVSLCVFFSFFKNIF